MKTKVLVDFQICISIPLKQLQSFKMCLLQIKDVNTIKEGTGRKQGVKRVRVYTTSSNQNMPKGEKKLLILF